LGSKDNTTGRPSGSETAVMYPAGLCNMTVTGASGRRPTPSTKTRSVPGRTRVPGVRTTSPFTWTRPAAISASHCRRDATPARAKNF
jgi:hypothetical protein